MLAGLWQRQLRSAKLNGSALYAALTPRALEIWSGGARIMVLAMVIPQPSTRLRPAIEMPTDGDVMVRPPVTNVLGPDAV